MLKSVPLYLIKCFSYASQWLSHFFDSSAWTNFDEMEHDFVAHSTVFDYIPVLIILKYLELHALYAGDTVNLKTDYKHLLPVARTIT